MLEKQMYHPQPIPGFFHHGLLIITLGQGVKVSFLSLSLSLRVFIVPSFLFFVCETIRNCFPKIESSFIV